MIAPKVVSILSLRYVLVFSHISETDRLATFGHIADDEFIEQHRQSLHNRSLQENTKNEPYAFLVQILNFTET